MSVHQVVTELTHRTSVPACRSSTHSAAGCIGARTIISTAPGSWRGHSLSICRRTTPVRKYDEHRGADGGHRKPRKLSGPQFPESYSRDCRPLLADKRVADKRGTRQSRTTSGTNPEFFRAVLATAASAATSAAQRVAPQGVRKFYTQFERGGRSVRNFYTTKGTR